MSKQIPLGGKHGKGKFAIVDDEDYEELFKYKWCLDAWGGYAVRFDNRRMRGLIKMHREIMKPPDKSHVDHINGNSLDNRRCNLRLCTSMQNIWNKRKKSGQKFKGVHPSGSGWRAVIQTNGKQHHIGTFATEIEAAMAYDEVAKREQGEFARLNFPSHL